MGVSFFCDNTLFKFSVPLSPMFPGFLNKMLMSGNFLLAIQRMFVTFDN